MHEVSIAEGILDLIERKLGEPVALESVDLRIGPLSGVSPDALEFCFARVAEARGYGTPELKIERMQVLVVCDDCHAEYATLDVYLPCPFCSSFRRTIASGQELTLLSFTPSPQGTRHV